MPVELTELLDKAIYRELVSQELEYKQRVKILYTEVAFPQTDGGWRITK
jgi:hypothetical protein